MKYRFAMMIATLGAISAGLCAQDAESAATRLAALMKRHDASKLGYVQKYQTFKPEFEALAKECAGTEAALTAELWSLRNAWWLRKEGKMESTANRVLERILAEYPASKQLDQVATYRYCFARDQQAAVMQRVQKLSPHDSVKAAMLLGRALIEKGKVRKSQLGELKTKYAKLPWNQTTYGVMADSLLNVHPKNALAVGEPAPEISGVDIDGVAFKLSDYKGKVVVLDFWGDW